jgi:hypothetical protein
VRPPGAVLDLSPGCALVLDGRQWTVERRIPHLGQVLLTDPDGRRQQVTFQFLLTHPRCFTSSRTAATGADRGRQETMAADLHPGKRQLAQLRMAHVLEMRTGFRSGSCLRPGPGEPKPEYNPDTTTLTERRLAKLAELTAIDPEQARLAELDQVSFRTLVRWDLGEQNKGIVGCADHRWLRESGGRPSITENIREAILAVREETLHRARMSMRDKHLLVCQHMRETYGPDSEVPSYRTLVRVWREWFGAGGARQRNARSAELPATKHGHIVISRPGQVVALDTTVLPVMVRDNTFGDPVTVHLTLALDIYTHSLVAFRLTLVSDKSVDVAMLLRDIMMPLPMRPGWGPEMAWPYPGIPAAVIADLAGYESAGLPYFAPETVTTDHGSVYKNHALREAERVLGCNILPARKLRPQDKGAVERAFGVIRQLLLGKLPGYTGVDVADRGADPEGDACLTVKEMEHLIASWIVGIWQTGCSTTARPSGTPTGRIARTRWSPRPSSRPALPWRSRARSCSTSSCQPITSPSARSAASRSRTSGMTTRTCWSTSTGRSRRAGAAATRSSGSSAATPATAARSTSRTRSATSGTRCSGAGCPKTATSPRSPMPAWTRR